MPRNQTEHDHDEPLENVSAGDDWIGRQQSECNEQARSPEDSRCSEPIPKSAILIIVVVNLHGWNGHIKAKRGVGGTVRGTFCEDRWKCRP